MTGLRDAPDSSVLEGLTAREREVLIFVGQDLSNEEIAARLYLSPLTAKTHVYRIMTKLHARDRAHLVVVGYETGLAVAEPRSHRAFAGAGPVVVAGESRAPFPPSIPVVTPERFLVRVPVDIAGRCSGSAQEGP